MKWLLISLALIAVCSALVTQEFVDEIHSLQSTWTATTEGRIAQMDREQFRNLLGGNKRSNWMKKHQLPVKTFTQEELDAAPIQFDSRENWPDCASMKAIRDQADCGSCWAFGAVESMSDRECVFNNRDLSYSAEDMLACSGCGDCPGGGDADCAYRYWLKTGLVEEDCSAYSLPSCDHHIPNSTNPCPNKIMPTPKCVKQCDANSTLQWTSDKSKGAKTYVVRGEANIMAEIAKSGPCEVGFDVYSDFEAYQGGVYHHTSGDYEGGHDVKIIGWGVTTAGVKYWLVANSWNPHWGEQGFFRILKGTNECGIEDHATCGIPVLVH